MDEQHAEEAIKALNKAGAINVGTAEGTPVSREHAQEIVQAIRKQKRDQLAVDDIVTRLRFVAQIHEGRVNHECIAEAADEIERLQEKNEWLDSHVGALIIGFRENKAEIERLRALITAFVSAWELSKLGENNGSEYFNAVHAMRQAVRGD